MRNASLALAAALVPMTFNQQLNAAPSTDPPAHVRSRFQFVLHVPLARAAPLFGPEGERCWAGGPWDPHFIYPQPARDIEGAVFTVQHGPHKSVWVNTIFDLAAGRMQYVAVIPETMVSIVDVRLTSPTSSSTSVDVTYTRTALDEAANEDVVAMGVSDRASGPDWLKAIEGCLEAVDPASVLP